MSESKEQTSKSTENQQKEMHPEPPRVEGRYLVIPIVILIIILSLVTFYLRNSIGGDRQNHYVRSTLELVNDYIAYSKGEWPRSWEDLEKMPTTGKWYEPFNFEQARKEVIIEFNATPEEIANQTPRDFHAIRALKPIFLFDHDPRVLKIIQYFRDHVQNETAKPNM